MAAEIRVDRITSRTGINTLSFTGDGFALLTNVGIGTTNIADKEASATNTNKLNVGIITAREIYANSLNQANVNITGIATVGTALSLADNVKAQFGTGGDLQIYHNGSHNYIQGSDGQNIYIDAGDSLIIRNSVTNETSAKFVEDGKVELRYDDVIRFETADGGAIVTGILTATQFSGGGIGVGIQSAGSVIGYGVTTLNFIGAGNTFAINGTTVDVSIAGGGGGGVSELSTDVNSTSPTGVGSFAVATYRSAAIIAQVDQSGTYQVGRYLMIHDGTTVTVVEEASVSTGASQIASYDGAIVGTNAEFRVTMVSSGIATVTTKIDTVTAYS